MCLHTNYFHCSVTVVSQLEALVDLLVMKMLGNRVIQIGASQYLLIGCAQFVDVSILRGELHAFRPAFRSTLTDIVLLKQLFRWCR